MIAEYRESVISIIRKQFLGNLEEHHYLEKSKISRAVYYKTNPDMVGIRLNKT